MGFIMKANYILTNVVLMIFVLFGQSAFGESFSIKMKVNVIEKGCDVYGEKGNGFPITVDFKEINDRDITSERYEREVIYNLDCGSDNKNNPKLRLTFKSELAEFSDNLIATSNNSLGLKMMANGKLLPPNQSYPFNYSDKPILMVKPVIDSQVNVIYGDFTASGVLFVDYD
nr:fimbrial protein [Pectobacterium carotovorum]